MSSDKLAPRSLSRISRPSSDAPQPVSFAVSGSAQWRSPADQAQPAGRRSTPAARRCHRADAESVAREVSIREEHAPLRGSGRLFHERSQLPGSPPRYAQGSCCGCPGGGPGRYCATSGLAASTKKTISVEISSHIYLLSVFLCIAHGARKRRSESTLLLPNAFTELRDLTLFDNS